LKGICGQVGHLPKISDILLIRRIYTFWRYFDEARLTAPSQFSFEVRLWCRSAIIIISTHQIPGSNI